MRGDLSAHGVEMSRYTTLRVGGLAEVVFTPHNEALLLDILKRESGIPTSSANSNSNAVSNSTTNTTNNFSNTTSNTDGIIIMGGGSKMLFPDGGVGKVLRICLPLCSKSVQGEVVEVSAGEGLISLARYVASLGLSGLEWACGIPGCVGGAVCMNAGAYGGDMASVVDSVQVFANGEAVWLKNSECGFGYRQSIFKNGLVVLRARLRLKYGNKDAIQHLMGEHNLKRVQSQPRGVLTCGSAFKRPTEGNAGWLIEKCGLKGMQIGGAMVSKIHANFVVNIGGATSKNVVELLELIEREVFSKFGVRLEREIIVV